MSSEDERIKAATNEYQAKTFATDIGQKAIVEHHSIKNDEYTAELRKVLVDMATDLQRTNKVNKEFSYLGSFSVHVYSAPITGTLAFAGINNPGSCHYNVAEAAVQKLKQDVVQYYTKRRQVKRSGF